MCWSISEAVKYEAKSCCKGRREKVGVSKRYLKPRPGHGSYMSFLIL